MKQIAERRGEQRAIAKRLNLRFAIVSMIFSILYAASLVVGRNLAVMGTCRLGAWVTWGWTLVLATPISIASYVLLMMVSCGWEVRSKRRFRFRVRHPFLVAWFVIVIAWMPVVVARWPGDFCFDAMWQTAFIAPDKTGISDYWSHLNAWHPPVHSLWLGGSLVFGHAMFGSYSAGLAIYTITQVLMFSLCLARVVSYAYESNHPIVYTVTLSFTALFPGFSVYATMTTKDVAYSGILALVVLWVYRTVKGDFPKDGLSTWLLRGFALFVLAMLMRNNALHTFLLVAFVAFIFQMTHAFDARRLLISLVPAVVFSIFVAGPVYSALQIKPGPSKEIMSVPSVQLASVMNEHADELSPADRRFIEQLVPDWRKYDRNVLADSTKEHFNTGLVSADPLGFARLYCKLALRYPGNFANAWALLSAGYWSQAVSYVDDSATLQFPLMCPYESVRGSLPQYLFVPFERPIEPLSSAVDALTELHAEVLIPVVNLLYKASTWFWVTVAYVFACIALHVPLWRTMPALVLLSYTLTLFLGPGSLYRYASPLFTSIPVLFVMLCDLVGASRTATSAHPSAPDRK